LDEANDEELRIREFKIEDYAAVRDLWGSAGLEFRPGDELEDIRLKLQRDPDLFLVAEIDSGIVGSVIGGWDGRRGWIYHLAVRPEDQRRGVGVSLIRELEGRLVHKGAKRVNAQVHNENEKSLEFFKALGYERQTHLTVIGKQLASK